MTICARALLKLGPSNNQDSFELPSGRHKLSVEVTIMKIYSVFIFDINCDQSSVEDATYKNW